MGFGRVRGLLAATLVAVLFLQQAAWAVGPPTLVVETEPLDQALVRKVRAEVGRRRVLVEPASLPGGESASTEKVAAEQRRLAVQLALERAKKRESEAEWESCVKEAAGAMTDAIEMIGILGDLDLVRELHLQAGVCMNLAGEAEGARLHFLAAALIDESPPRTGIHREEAEAAQGQAQMEIVARPRGRVRIASEPSGAEVWIDGKLVSGKTPLEVDVRLGDHFVTVRRFRYEPNTEQRLLQPSGAVRVVLEPAHRDTLREQLAAAPTRTTGLNPDEGLLAIGAWSRAEHVLVLSRAAPPNAGAMQLRLLEVSTSRVVGTSVLSASAGSSELRRVVCDLLAEVCEPDRGIAWYVWPLAGAALVGAAVTTGLLLENHRATRFCPPSGCR